MLREFFSRETGNASTTLAALQSAHKGSDFDWEAVLEFNYTTLLSGRQDIGVIDIGGHAGRHTSAILKSLEPAMVAVFEPLPEQFRLLTDLFSENPRVKLFNMALSNRRGKAKFIHKIGAPEESGLRQRSQYNDRKTDDLQKIEVSVRTLDSIDFGHRIDFIKIDTEGAELDILRGANNLIRKNRPVISVEFGVGAYDAYGHKPTALFDFATLRRYAVFDLMGNRVLTRHEWRLVVDKFYWDFLMIPTEKLPLFSDRIEKIRALNIHDFLIPPVE